MRARTFLIARFPFNTPETTLLDPNTEIRSRYEPLFLSCRNYRPKPHRDFITVLDRFGITTQSKKAEQLAAKAVDFSTLVFQLTQQGRLRLAGEVKDASAVTYHDSCHLKRTLEVFREPRELLMQAGHEVREVPEADVCCGMGGSYSLKMPAISQAVPRRKLENIGSTGAPDVSTDCPGCVLQIRGGRDSAGMNARVRHTAERLAERLERGGG